ALRLLRRQQRLFEAKVVVETLLQRRAEADHGYRKVIEHRRGHHVRRRVAQGFEVFAHDCPRRRVSRLYEGYWWAPIRRAVAADRPGCRLGPEFAHRETPRCPDG